ncbi:MAG: nuclear transport factor 2 family protein [Flavobacteriales bacterium]|nr:nuclear transport factor 2 family protein [Flavobacteriales bacterium]
MLRESALLLLLLLALPGFAQLREEQAVLGTIDRFFAAMTSHDTAAMATTVVREGSFHIASLDGSTPARTVLLTDYLVRLASGPERFVERYWDAAVRVDATVASATMAYDFHVDGKFSHCGVDLFTLVKGPDGWRIASVAFTRQAEGCAPSPLGPFKP